MSMPADIGIRTGSETLRYIAADLQRRPHTCTIQCLCVGIGADEIDAL